MGPIACCLVLVIAPECRRQTPLTEGPVTLDTDPVGRHAGTATTQAPKPSVFSGGL